MAAAAGGIIGGIGSLAGGAMQSSAIKDAAQTQANASNYAADQQYKSAQEALSLQQGALKQQQANSQPFLDVADDSLNRLKWYSDTANAGLTNYGLYDNYNNGADFNYQSFDPGAAFAAPTAASLTDDPGYQSRLNAGQQALERSAAAKGSSLSGGALKALTNYAQDYASNEYSNSYNRALQTYQTNYGDSLNAYTTNRNNASQNYAQNYNQFNANKAGVLNQLNSQAGLGQTAAGQLNSAAANSANSSGNILTNAANVAGQYTTGAANANAAGTVGTANVWNQALSGATNNIAQILNKSSYGAGGGYSGNPSYYEASNSELDD